MRLPTTVDTEIRTLGTFQEFKEAKTLADTVAAFEALASHAASASASVLQHLGSQNHHQIKRAIDPLKRVMETNVAERPLCGTRVVVVGAGPGGLRAAFEACKLGATVDVLEQRPYLSRNNVLVLWPQVVDDLISQGLKVWYPKFGTASSEKLSIRKLQLTTLKLALLAGANVHVGIAFSGLEPPEEDGAAWRVVSRSALDEQVVLPRSFECHQLIGADGERSRVRDTIGFPGSITQFSKALGITFNLENSGTVEEMQLAECGFSRQYKPAFFQALAEQTGVLFETLIYYRSEETHYFVLATHASALHAAGVIKHAHPLAADCAAPANVNRVALVSLARAVATFVKHDARRPFATTHRGEEDVAVFDFTKKMSVDHASCCLEGPNGMRLFTHLVGDASAGPFWPQATGANRAILGALDATHAMGVTSRLGGATEAEVVAALEQQRDTVWARTKTSTAADLRATDRAGGGWAPDPSTRFKRAPLLKRSRTASDLTPRGLGGGCLGGSGGEGSTAPRVRAASATSMLVETEKIDGVAASSGSALYLHWRSRQHGESQALAVRPRSQTHQVDLVQAMSMAMMMEEMGMEAAFDASIADGIEAMVASAEPLPPAAIVPPVAAPAGPSLPVSSTPPAENHAFPRPPAPRSAPARLDIEARHALERARAASEAVREAAAHVKAIRASLSPLPPERPDDTEGTPDDGCVSVRVTPAVAAWLRENTRNTGGALDVAERVSALECHVTKLVEAVGRVEARLPVPSVAA